MKGGEEGKGARKTLWVGGQQKGLRERLLLGQAGTPLPPPQAVFPAPSLPELLKASGGPSLLWLTGSHGQMSQQHSGGSSPAPQTLINRPPHSHPHPHSHIGPPLATASPSSKSIDAQKGVTNSPITSKFGVSC